MVAIPCGFESHHRHHVGAKSALLRRSFFAFSKKERHPPAPLLLLSKPNPLRWASVWFLLGDATSPISPPAPRRSKLRIACSDSPPFKMEPTSLGFHFVFLEFISANAIRTLVPAQKKPWGFSHTPGGLFLRFQLRPAALGFGLARIPALQRSFSFHSKMRTSRFRDALILL